MYVHLNPIDPIVGRVFWYAVLTYCTYQIGKMGIELWGVIFAKPKYRIVSRSGGRTIVEKYIVISGEEKILGTEEMT